MKVVIELDSTDYMYIKNGCFVPIKIDNHIYDAIRSGTVLPEVHGSLIDADVAYKKAYNRSLASVGQEILDATPTVIPADKEEDNNEQS